MTPQSNIRCAVYTREALAPNVNKISKCISGQQQTCEAFIADRKEKGWTLDSTSYCDSGFSGINGKRPGLRSILRKAKHDEIDIIIIQSFDRLARDQQLMAAIVKTLEMYGVELISVSDQEIDPFRFKKFRLPKIRATSGSY